MRKPLVTATATATTATTTTTPPPQAKMTLLRSAPVQGEALRRTDLRRLAYAAERRALGRNAVLYEQGAAPAGLELIVEGHCKVGGAVVPSRTQGGHHAMGRG